MAAMPAFIRAGHRLTLLQIITALMWRGGALVPPFAPFAGWLLFGALLSIAGVPDYTGTSLWQSYAGFFWLMAAILLWRGIYAYRASDPIDINRILERHVGLAHRPLDTVSDRLFNDGDTTTEKYWTQNVDDAAHVIRQLRLPPPPRVWPVIDPYGIRYILIGLLIAAIFYTGTTTALPRLRAGLMPWDLRVTLTTPLYVPDFSLTVTPPAYTNLPAAIMPGNTITAPVPLLPGTTIDAKIGASNWPTVLWVGWHPHLLRHDRTITLADNLPEQATITLQRGLKTIARIPVEKTIDTPPRAEWTGTPKITPDGHIRLPVRISDDFGIDDMNIHLRAADANYFGIAPDEYVRRPFNMTGGLNNIETTIDLDLTASFLAGENVTMGIDLVDHLGQSTTLPTLAIPLPERRFQNPVSKMIIAARHDLITEVLRARIPVARAMFGILPEKRLFGNDVISVLSLRVAAERLARAENDNDLRTVISLMWRVATRLDGGGDDLNDAMTKLAATQQKLQNLLRQNDVSAADLDAAMQEMQAAMQAALQALMTKLSKSTLDPRLAKMMEQFPDSTQKMMDQDLFGDFMRQLQAEIKAGNKEKAAEMLKQLQRMTDQMQNPQTSMPQDMADLMDLVDDIQNVITKQRTLRDESDKAAMQDKPETKSLGEQQQKLLTDLDKIAKKIGDRFPMIPENFGRAAENMKNASEKLGTNQPGPAVDDQSAAIKELEQGQQNAAQQLMQMMKQMVMIPMPNGQPGAMSQGQPGDQDDQQGQSTKNFDVKSGGRERLRNIMKTLRDRMTQGRPREEREYFERLLQQF